jgi:amidase
VAVRAGQGRSTELVEHPLARMDALDGGLGAFSTITPERALAAAAWADARGRAGGELPPIRRSPACG